MRIDVIFEQADFDSGGDLSDQKFAQVLAQNDNVVLAGKFPMSNYYVDGIQIVILNKLIVIGKHTKIQGIEDNDGDWIADIMKNEFCECENCVEQRKSNKDSNIK